MNYGNRSRISVIGAGAIGMRHLESMARIEATLTVDVIDPSPDARAKAIQNLQSVGGLRQGRVNEYAHLDEVDSIPDIVIVATDSRSRRGCVEAAVSKGVRCLVLEKVLFTRLGDYDAVGALLAESGTEAWVNCPRRSYPRADWLRDLVDGKPIDYSVTGNGWGLATNLIHYLDEFAWLIGRDDLDLSMRELQAGTLPAKRPGYVEFAGKVSGAGGDARFAALCGAGAPDDRIITIRGKDIACEISLIRREALVTERHVSRTEPYPIVMQSELTAGVVSELLSGRKPKLAPFVSSANLHRRMLSGFLDHLRLHTGKPDIDECPIT